jgi:hypothetical protein
MQMAFNEGARAFGQEFQDRILTICPDHFVTMLTENDTDDRINADRASPSIQP